MNKPKILMPFIYVYRFIYFLFKLVIKFFKNFNIGLFFTLFVFIDIIVSSVFYFIKMVLYGIVYLSYSVYSMFKYIAIGLGMFFKYSYIVIKKILIAIISIPRYIYLGFITTCYCLYKVIETNVRYIVLGFTTCCYCVYKIIYLCLRYIYLGFITVCHRTYCVFKTFGYVLISPLIISRKLYFKLKRKYQLIKAKHELEMKKSSALRDRNRQIQEENRKRLAEERQREREELLKQKEKDVYINENLTLEKKKLTDYLNELFGWFRKIGKKIKDLFVNNHFVRNAKNKKDINRQALLLDFEGEDAEKSEKKVMYKYVARNPDGKIVKGVFPAYSKVEVHSFLLSEGNEVYSIITNKWIQMIYGDGAAVNKAKIKTKDLIFFTTQLSTYIKAGIPLVESLKILSRQFKNKTYARIFRSMIYDLTMGDNFAAAMDKQGEAFPRLLINMAKTAEMTGELPEVLDDMSEYFTEIDKTRKQMITAMTYPAIIFVFAIAAIIFIMVWVVPQFVEVYEGIDGAQIPGITIFVMNVSNFLQNSYLYLIAGIIIFILVFIYLYKNVKMFKTFIQWLLMHVPVISNVIIYNEVTMFTKTFASLLAHNVFITDSMEILNKITNNEIYKMLILDTITNLARGEKLSLAFKDHWAFPMPAYEMITTGERTGQLPEMMEKVSDYYQELHRNSVTRIKTFVEPILILFLTFVVGGVVLSIVIPMFSIYTAIQM